MKCFLTGLILLIFSGAFSQHQVRHFNTTYQDTSRGNRNIETEVYYPATTAGDNTPMTSGQFPVIVFGHGFVMVWSAYPNLWEEFVPNGWEFSLSNEIYSDLKGNIYETIGVPPHYEIVYPEDRTDFYNSFYSGNEFRDIGIDKIVTWHNTVYK